MAEIFDDRNTVRSVFGQVLTLVLLAALLAALLLSVINDMYAFFKPQEAVLLHVDAPRTLSEFSRMLEENGVLLNPHVFFLYVRARKSAPLIEDFSGDLSLDCSMSYREILHALQKAQKIEAN